MKIGIVTGATGGIGKAFLGLLAESPNRPDEIWAVGRNMKKLQVLRGKYGAFIKPVFCDLGDPRQFAALLTKIASADAEISLLINSAGLVRMAPCRDFTQEEISAAIDINSKALTLLCSACIPKMKAGSRILNLSSASSFQPNP